jgi:hypothetical protein
MSEGKLVQSFRRAQAKLIVQTADLPLGTLADMVDSGSIDLEPGFQRRERWNHPKQSALIESFLLNVPVPPIYLSEESDGTYTAIDGKQRLRAIADFMAGRFALRGLEGLVEAENSRFETLPTEVTNALRLRPFLRVVTLLKQTDPLLKYEVFLRLNRGGESLNAQEIRNVAFRGPLNDKVYQLSESAFLKKQLKIENQKSAAFREMIDAEYVLRFLTLENTFNKFGGGLGSEMNDFMRKNQHAADGQLRGFEVSFQRALEACEGIWGSHAFRRPEGEGWRDQTLAGMFDAQMLSVAMLSNGKLDRAIERRRSVVSGTRRLFDDAGFDKSVRTGTNTPARIKYRVGKMKDLLESL